MNGEGIKFCPLYWIYHDNWINRNWGWSEREGWQVGNTSRHMGHLHFFMPDYQIDKKEKKGAAYSGKQTYSFSLKSVWGPGSGDVNQSNDVQYIGSPKWYFEAIEYWRRVYIQPWEDKEHNSMVRGDIGKVGIKWDASHPKHTYGPFREGRNFFFYWNKSARTLPIEYFLDGTKRLRDNYLYGSSWYLPVSVNYDISDSSSNCEYMKNYKPIRTPFFIPNGDDCDGYVDRPMCYRINQQYHRDEDVPKERFDKWKNVAIEIGATHLGEKEVDNGTINIIKYCDYGYHEYPPGEMDSNSYSLSYKTPFGAYNVSCADHRYIYPIIEYQRVKRLNWERLPGWEQRDRFNGGDGFDISITLPYTLKEKIQSPFSDDEGKVSPMGTYHHEFEKDFSNSIPRYPYCDKVDIGNYEWVIVRRTGNEYLGFQENEVRRIIGDRPSDKDLESGESIATFPPFVNGYVEDEKGRPAYVKREDITTEEYRIPDSWKDKIMKFNIPQGMPEDGKWVEQCLGGVVKAKAVVKIKDNFGEIKDVEVTTTRFYIAEQFEGKDQNEPESNSKTN